MKSCLGITLSLLASVLVVGGGALLWYVSHTAEFSRKANPPAPTASLPPRAIPVQPPAKR